MDGMDAEEREREYRPPENTRTYRVSAEVMCIVFAIGQEGERRIKLWYDTPLGRAKSYSGR
jgi:hypothetical protein